MDLIILLVMKSVANDELLCAINCLMFIVHTKPSTIFYAEEFSFLGQLSSK